MVTYTATSSPNGDYTFALLKPGDYSLSVTKDGFSTSKRTVAVQLGTTVNANVALEIGTSSTTVEVTSEQGLFFKRKTPTSLPILRPNKSRKSRILGEM